MPIQDRNRFLNPFAVVNQPVAPATNVCTVPNPQPAVQGPQLPVQGPTLPSWTSYTPVLSPFASMYGVGGDPTLSTPAGPSRPAITPVNPTYNPTTQTTTLAGQAPPEDQVAGTSNTQVTGSLTTGAKNGTTGAVTSTTTTPDDQGNTSTDASSVSANYNKGTTTVSVQNTQGTTQADGSGQSTQNTNSIGYGNGNVTVTSGDSTTTTNQNGTSATQGSSDSVKFNEDGATLTNTQTDSVTNKDGTGTSESTSTSVGYNAEDNAVTVGGSNTNTLTTQGENGQNQTTTTTNSGNVTVGENTFGGNYSTTTTDGSGNTNGYSVNGNINTEEGTVTGGGTVTTNGTTVGGNVTVGEDQVGASVSLKRGQFGVSGGFNVIAGEVSTDEHSGDVTAGMLGGDYMSTAQRNQVDLSASASYRGIGVSGSMTSGNTIEALSSSGLLPANWDDMTAEQKATFEAEQESRLATYQDGVSVEDLLSLESGQGVRTTSYNGWSLGGSVPIGGVASLSAGGGQTSAHEVTMVRGPSSVLDENGNPSSTDRIIVNIASQNGNSSELGAAFMGVGLNFGATNDKTHQYQIEIDPAALQMGPDGKPANPEAYNAVQMMLNTGLMPGSNNLTGEGMPERYAAFESAYQQVGPLTTTIDQQRARLEDPNLSPADAQAIRQELVTLYGQLDTAQQTIETNREILNQGWEQTYGVDNQPQIPGVLVTSETNSNQDGNTMSVAGTQIASTQRTWTEQQRATHYGTEHSFTYNEQNYFLGSLSDSFTGTANNGIDPNAPMFGMISNDQVLLDDNADVIKNVQNRDVPDYVLDDPDRRFHMRGTLEVTMNPQQWNTMTAAMNDMSNPQSAAMWQDMGTRVTQFVGGEKYWLDDPGMDDNMAAHYAQGRESDRMGWINDQLNPYVNGPDGQPTPVQRALRAFGDTPEAAMAGAAAAFQDVTSPQAFQALPPDQQQLFIALLDQTSGEEDITGQRSSFESLAAISLIEDPVNRASTLTHFMADANDEASSDYRSGAVEFVEFTDRFKDNPAVYNVIQQGISFDWQQDNAERMAGGDSASVDKALQDAFNESRLGIGLFGRDINEGKALDALMAANMQGGPQRILEAVNASGVNVVEIMNAFPENSVDRRLYLDLISQVPELQAQITAATTCPA